MDRDVDRHVVDLAGPDGLDLLGGGPPDSFLSVEFDARYADGREHFVGLEDELVADFDALVFGRGDVRRERFAALGDDDIEGDLRLGLGLNLVDVTTLAASNGQVSAALRKYLVDRLEVRRARRTGRRNPVRYFAHGSPNGYAPKGD